MEGFAADDGEILRLRVIGDGPPLILLHGWCSSHSIWNPLLADLSRHYRVYAPDARGHGGHISNRDSAPDVARLARDLNNLLDSHGIERAAVVGHSMGALTLWQYVRDFGCDRLGKLCLVDQSPRLVTDAEWRQGIYGDFDALRSQALIDELGRDFAETVLRLAAYGLNVRARAGYEADGRGWRQQRDALRKLAPAPLIAIWRSLVRADFREVLPALDRPVLLIHGEQSNFYPAATADYLLARLPQARLLTYPAADHSPQLADPTRFAADLLDFFLSDGPQG